MATPTSGLSADAAARRLALDGPNELRREAPTPRWRILARQFTSPMIALLAAAAVLAAALGEWVDAGAILVIVALNGLVGFVQEHRAENAVRALRAMTAPRARVRRDGQAQVVAAREVVVGDLLLLEAGDLVAADARLVEASRLATNEAALTGESAPVDKDPAPRDTTVPLADRTDRVHAGTAVVGGVGVAEVEAVGMGTELGRIAHLLQTAEDGPTPLQVRLGAVSRTLVRICLGVVAGVAVLGLVKGQPWLEVLLSAVSLAVAAVPEGLPAVITIALAVGVQRMAARNVLVRRLPAVEALGSATVVCTDKTGTLTTGTMTVREVWGPDARALLEAAAANCDAELATGTGDPTELALLAAAAEHGIDRATLEAARPRVRTFPFDATRKRMSVLRADGVLYVKGAPDLTIPLCVAGPEGALEANAALARRGLRVLAVAVGEGEREEGLRLLGLVGIADPPRPEAVVAVAEARAAGIRPVMITGDHPVTAHAIARELGIVVDEEGVEDRVHARVTPEEKLAIVRRWKERGEIVAMTGDGVNDAPALREAHVGIAMGRGGTEVTREAADVVLTDDNFASVIAGVREGRGIYENIRKTLVYLLSGNASELAVMTGAALLGLPLPLLPVQLLWINLVTDGLPALALVVDPVDPGVLTRPPRPPDEPLLGRAEWRRIGVTAAIEALVVLGVFTWASAHEGLDAARDLAFTTLVFAELFRAFAARSPDRVFWSVGAFGNLALLAVVGVSASLQVLLHVFAPIRAVFGLTAQPVDHLLVALGLGLVPVTVIEVVKLIRRRA